MHKLLARIPAAAALASVCLLGTPAVGNAAVGNAAPAAQNVPSAAATDGQSTVTWTFIGYNAQYDFYGYSGSDGSITATTGWAGYSFTGTLSQLMEKARNVATLPE